MLLNGLFFVLVVSSRLYCLIKLTFYIIYFVYRDSSRCSRYSQFNSFLYCATYFSFVNVMNVNFIILFLLVVEFRLVLFYNFHLGIISYMCYKLYFYLFFN